MINTDFNVNRKTNKIISKNKIRKKNRARRRKIKWISVLIIICIILITGICGKNTDNNRKELSKEVLNYKPMVEKYADEYGISKYTNYLLAIMQVESAGVEEDVMQSSESLGLEPNSLNTEQSIKQGCKYFSELVRLAEDKNCDIKSVIQAYNYGKGFLDYVDNEGDKYSFDIAEDFAEKNSKDVKISYNNPIAIKANGGWRYKYGNMFYVDLVYEYMGVEQ